MKRLHLLIIVLTISCLLLSGCKKQTITTTIEEEIITETVTDFNTPSEKTGASSGKSSSAGSSSSGANKNPASSTNNVPKPTAPQQIVIDLPASDLSESTGGTESTPDLPDDLEVPPSKRPCYSQLTKAQQSAYESIAAMVRRSVTGFVKLPNTTLQDIPLVYQAVNADYPEYFWMPYRYIVASNNGEYYIAMSHREAEYDFDYLYTPEEIREVSSQLTKALQEIRQVVTGTSSYTRELQIHDYLCEHITYAETQEDVSVYNIYGALIRGSAVCEGYSKAMQYLCRCFGIECLLVTGITYGVGHMWNQVKIEDDWYNLDVTWDDSASSGSRHWYSYFNVTDEIITLDHTFDISLSELPDGTILQDDVSYNLIRMSCTATEANYAYRNDLLLSNDKTDVKFAATSAILKAANADSDVVEMFLLPEIDITGKKAADIYRDLEISKAVDSANGLLKSAGKKQVSVISCSVNGRGFRLSIKRI